MKKSVLLLLLLTFCTYLGAQRTITGTVVDANDEPMIGASVYVAQQSNIGTDTDLDGKFTLDVPRDAQELVISYLGYNDLRVPITAENDYNIVLAENTAQLEEFVVVGYGSQKKSLVTGAISSVSAEDLEDMPNGRLEQALQGRTSGVRVTLNSGQPGAGATVRIRGTATIGNSDPLYVVDGVQIEGGIDFLNQSDIESIEVLKDAAAAAIYGARAANGVVLVTTKKGKAGTMSVNYSGYYGVQNPWRKLDLLNAREYGILLNEAAAGAGQPVLFENPDALGEGTDWQDAVFNENAPIMNHELSLTAGSERSQYYASFGYFDQTGIVGNADDSRYQRLNIRLNSTHQVSDRVEFGANVAYARVVSSGVAENTEFGSPLGRAVNLDPITPLFETDGAVLSQPRYANNFDQLVRDENGNIYGISNIITSEILNPVAALEVQQGRGFSDKIVSSFYGQVEIIDGLKFRSSFGSDLAFFGGEGFSPIHYLNAANRLDQTSYSRSLNRGFFWNFENTLSYQKTFGDHQMSFLAGTGAQRNSGIGQGGAIRDLPVNSLGSASLLFPTDPASQTFNGFEYNETLSSLFGRVTYNYMEKYLLTANLRRDGSSKFGPNKLYGVFPSVSVGWVPTQEAFWTPPSFLDFLKIRASYGVNGNNRIGNFLFVSTVGGGRSYTFGTLDDLVNGVSPNALANPDLQWEETSELNFGLDARLFEKFSLTAEYFLKDTEGMLLGVTVPAFVGNVGPVGNIASLENQGFELEAGYRDNINGFEIDFSANVAYVENTITSLGLDKEFLNGQFYGPQGLELTRTIVGQPFGAFFGYKSNGLFQTAEEVASYTNADGELLQPNAQPGDIRFIDVNEDGLINEDDRTTIGDPTPTWTYGVSLNLNYKGFDLNLFGQGVGGNEVYNAIRRFDLPRANYTTAALDRWTGPNSTNSFPRLNLADGDPIRGNGNFSRSSDFWLQSGAFFRIKTLQLGYTLPTDVANRIGMDRARIYVSGNNLITLTPYDGLDPEVGAGMGVDRGIYPQPRFYLVGVNLTL